MLLDKTMKATYTKAAITLTIILVIFSTIAITNAQDYTITYQLLNQPDGRITYKLNVAIPETLREYYTEKNHRSASASDFSKFVTPYALKPIADRLWEIYSNGEDFANGALMIVHQITYVETKPAKYPVETMVDGQGDCDLFSYIAASIMMAGGLDVVLLYYEEQTHMNIGVHLSSPPEDARENAYYITYSGRRYYIAECTGGNWESGWHVGECPEDLKKVSAKVITLEDAEQVAPGQVSATFTTVTPSYLSLETPIVAFPNSIITINGQLTPAVPSQNVTLYASLNGALWTIIGTTVTQPNGHFQYTWAAKTAGLHSIRASWQGNDAYAGAISPTETVMVIPFVLTALIGVAVASAAIGAVAALMAKHTQQQEIIEQ
ncbi:MAG: Ig-like domain-containing protein [Candidatus Bathyarchaeota archaeon]|nr:Ig-like domain-containing protein [Candidatus Bathyarchaeota archaeon]